MVSQRSSPKLTPGRAASRWVLLSTFDPDGRASDSTAEQVRAYRQAGFDVLIVDTSPSLSAQRRGDWESDATRWFQRPNRGYDFGSFKAGLEYLVADEQVTPTGGLDLIITNDSCFGPFVPLAPLIESFDRAPRDGRRVFGITDSVYPFHHIQSYWVYFRADVVPLAFDFLLKEMRDATNRDEAIENGELGLGRFLARSGCTLEAAFPVSTTVGRLATFNGWFGSTLELCARRVLKRWKYNRHCDTHCLRHLLHYPSKMKFFNPAVLYGLELYRKGEMPFLKKSMFRENVYHEPGIPTGLDVASMTNADVRALLDPSPKPR